MTGAADATTHEAARAPVAIYNLTPRVAAILIALLALTASTLSLFITRTGTGLSRDARSYLQLSRFIAATGIPGHVDENGNVTGVETHFPPGYPYLLSVAGRVMGDSALSAARYVDALLLAGSITLAAAIAWSGTRSPARGVAAAVLFSAAVGTCHTHLSVSSEPPFGFLMLAALFALTLHDRRGGWRWLILAAAVAGIGVLVRYAGMALVLAGSVALVSRPRPIAWRRRILQAVVFAAIAALPILGWIAWYTLHTGNALAARPGVTWNATGSDRLLTALGAIGEWIAYEFYSTPLRFTLGGIALLSIIALVTLALRRLRSTDAAGLAAPLAYVVVYPLFLLFSVSFVDAATPFDRRILYPLHVSCVLLLVMALPQRRWANCLLVVFVLTQALSAAVWLRTARELQLGYNSLTWQREPAIVFLRSLPRNATIVTDNTEVVELAAGRSSIALPRVDTLADPGDRDAHRLAMAELRTRVPDGAYLILINRNKGSRRYTPLSRLAKAFALRPAGDFPTGPAFIIERPELRPTTQHQ